jgi:KDO2-lipid IV(A) lauroyltransferase
MLKENFYLLGMMLVEGLNAVWPSKSNILPTIGSITGFEHVEKALNEKRGVLLLFSHFIAIYLVGYLLLSKVNVPFSIMYHSPRNAVLKRFFDVNLKKHCNQVFTRRDVHKMVRHLRDGNLVWYSPDLEPNKKHRIFAPFFGIPTATFTTTARIAKMADTVNIPIAFYRRDNEDVYDVIFHPPLENFPSTDEEKDAALLNKTVENLIRVKPSQYLWIYKKFSKMPDDNPGLY